jgi:SOS-response transcriptional repressor LexA
MSNWVMRAKERMLELEMTQEGLAKEMGKTRGAITHYLGGRRQPPLSEFSKLAKILKVDPAWLQFGTPAISKNDLKSKENRFKHLLPIFSWEEIAASINNKTIKQVGKRESIPYFYTEESSWYALKIKGDSMIAAQSQIKSFYEGDIIVIDPDKAVTHGSYVIALLRGANEVTFKQFVIDGGVRYLKPLNPQYPIIKIEKDTYICGTVTACLSFTI